MKQDLASHKTLLAIFCGLLWWYGYALAWVMLVPLTWILFSSGKFKIKSVFLFFVTAAITYLSTVPLAFYLYIPEKGTGRFWGNTISFLLALAVVAAVAMWDGKQKSPMWQKLWWRGLLAGAGLIIVLVALSPVFGEILEGKDNPQKIAEWINGNIKEDSLLILPLEAALKTAQLNQRYHILPLETEQLNRRKLDILTALYEKTFIISPDWKVMGPDPAARRMVEEWNAIVNLSRKRMKIEGAAILANRLYPVETENPALGIYAIPSAEGAGFTILRPWNGSVENPKLTSPALHSLGMRGTFKLDYTKGRHGNVLSISNTAANKKGERICQIGYTANKRGLSIPVHAGALVHFIAEVRISDRLAINENLIFIQDYNGTWERRFSLFIKGGWTTAIVSKRIRRRSSQLMLGFRFLPKNTKDKLEIRKVYICLEDRS